MGTFDRTSCERTWSTPSPGYTRSVSGGALGGAEPLLWGRCPNSCNGPGCRADDTIDRTAPMPGSDIDPPDLGIKPIDGSQAADAAQAADPVGEIGTADAAEGADPVGAAGRTEAAEVASALASGTIDAATAKAQLIDAAVRDALPVDADPEMVAAVRAEVESIFAGDPVLADLLRR